MGVAGRRREERGRSGLRVATDSEGGGRVRGRGGRGGGGGGGSGVGCGGGWGGPGAGGVEAEERRDDGGEGVVGEQHQQTVLAGCDSGDRVGTVPAAVASCQS